MECLLLTRIIKKVSFTILAFTRFPLKIKLSVPVVTVTWTFVGGQTGPALYNSTTLFSQVSAAGLWGWSILNLSPYSAPGFSANWQKSMGTHSVCTTTPAHSENWNLRDWFSSTLACRHWMTTLSQEYAGIFLLEWSELNSTIWGHPALHWFPRLSPFQAVIPKACELYQETCIP